MPGRGRTRNWQDSLNIFEDSQIGGYQSMWDMHYMGSVISQGLQGFITVVSLVRGLNGRSRVADIGTALLAGHQLDGRLFPGQVVCRAGQGQVPVQVGRDDRPCRIVDSISLVESDENQ